LLDLGIRFSVNLMGGPSMSGEQFLKWKQKTVLGLSLRMIAPTGQYSPKQLINWGINRWAFKPELGYSRRWGNWVADGYGGARFYAANSAEFHMPLPAQQTEEPIGSLEGHLSRDFGRGTWASLDGNFWWGGVTTLNGIRNPGTRQTRTPRGYRRMALFQAPVLEGQLQRWHLRPLWWRLPEHFRRAPQRLPQPDHHNEYFAFKRSTHADTSSDMIC
jgi:hypothetical protein